MSRNWQNVTNEAMVKVGICNMMIDMAQERGYLDGTAPPGPGCGLGRLTRAEAGNYRTKPGQQKVFIYTARPLLVESPTDDQIRRMVGKAHEHTMEILKGQIGAKFSGSYMTTLQYNNWESFAMAAVNYSHGMSEGLFMKMFMDMYNRMPTESENQSRLDSAELHKEEMNKIGLELADSNDKLYRYQR